jgi:cysteinyl-tRNA synthetase
VNEEYLEKFKEAMDDDFNCPRAMAVLWELARDEKAKGKVETIKKMDEVFGLKLFEEEDLEVPEEVLKLAKEREVARGEKDWKKSDELRDLILEKGFVVKDSGDEFVLERA